MAQNPYSPDDPEYSIWERANQPQPGLPGFTPIWNPDMAMTPEAERRLGGIQMDRRGLDQFRREALRQGPSAWAMLQHRQQNLLRNQARDRAAKDAAGARAGAFAGLQRTYGARSGARERLAKSGMKDVLAMNQDIAGQTARNKLQIGINDEQNRMQQLSSLPGMEIAALGPEFQKMGIWGQSRQTDIGNQMSANRAQNEYNQKIWEEQMRALGAAQQASATAAAGGGSWLCTIASHVVPFSKKEIRALMKLKRFAQKHYPELADFYIFDDGKELVNRMRAGRADWSDNRPFVEKVISLVLENNLMEAVQFYTDHVYKKIRAYWPECQHPLYLNYKGVIGE